jgi:hypothetical protein
MFAKLISARVVLAISMLGLVASCVRPLAQRRGPKPFHEQLRGPGMRRLAAGMSTIILVLGACSSVSFVDELSIINDTEYSANVEVTDEGRDGWLALNNVESQSMTVVEDVIDQGEVWVFRFDYLGRYQVEVEVSGRELAQSDWSIEVPQSFEQGLRDMGVPPPP